MQALDGVFYIIVLIMSIVAHEFAHGYMAYRLGDNTAHDSGRLTLNPLKHLDPFGSVILPLLLLATGTNFLIGWARPVPYNPNNLRNRKTGTILVSIAGIVTNVFIAILFGCLIRYASHLGLPAYNPDPLLQHTFYKIATSIVFINLVLALFNLVPIPPLDGSRILFALLPKRLYQLEAFLDRWGIVVLIIFIFFIWGMFSPLLYSVFSFLTGIA